MPLDGSRVSLCEDHRPPISLFRLLPAKVHAAPFLRSLDYSKDQ